MFAHIRKHQQWLFIVIIAVCDCVLCRLFHTKRRNRREAEAGELALTPPLEPLVINPLHNRSITMPTKMLL